MPKKPKKPSDVREDKRVQAFKIVMPSVPVMRVLIVRSIDQHAGRPAIADVTDPFAHVEIFIGDVRYRLTAKDGKLELSGTEHGLVVEPVASNVVLIGPSRR